MAISHELSSEIAAALLTAKEKSRRELDDLKDIVLTVHRTLEQLAKGARADRHAAIVRRKTAGKDN